jgi:hypothetical protein
MIAERVKVMVVAAIFPCAFAAYVFFNSNHAYEPWAKLASVIGLVAGLIWWALQFVVAGWMSLHLSPHAFYQLLTLKGTLVGLVLGLFISILLGRPYRDQNKPGELRDVEA